MSNTKNPLGFDIEDYIDKLSWFAGTTNRERTLVACNLRELYAVLTRRHDVMTAAIIRRLTAEGD